MRCIMPHVNLEIRSNGTIGPCCLNYHVYRDDSGVPFDISTHSIGEIWNSKSRRDYAKALDDAPLDDCRQCWDIEAGGGQSKRLSENKIRKNRVAETPTGLDIKFSNVCNLRCVICGPYNSTQWYNDWKSLKGREFDNSRYKWINDDDVLDRFNEYVVHCDVLEFYGGEPLLIKQHLDILQRCVDYGVASKQEIRLNTNGTVRITDRHIDLYSRFAKVSISWSIDGASKEEFEYQRYPANFDEVMDNLRHCESHLTDNVLQNITHTVSAMNILSLPEMLDFVRQRSRMPLHLNVLADPNMLNYCRLPKAAIDEALNRCDQSGITFNGPNINGLMAMEYRPSDQYDLIHYLDRIDSSRGTNWRSSLKKLDAVL